VILTGQIVTETWNGTDGTKKSKIVIKADEVGAGLRFATAEVHRVEREDPQAPASDDF
jgi:single-stranded DNA-binding protein